MVFTIDPVMGPGWEYEIQGNYGDGWEPVNTETTPSNARRSLSEYDENEPEYPHRIRRVRA